MKTTDLPFDLQAFCSTDETRHCLCIPFSKGEYTYATDARILVQVPRLDDVPSEREGYNFPNVNMETNKWVDGPWSELPEINYLPELEACKACLGLGKFEDCKKCEGDGVKTCGECGEEKHCNDCDGMGDTPSATGERVCKECDGTGKCEATQQMDIGHRLFDVQLIHRVSQLPGVMAAITAGDACDPLSFKFDGGKGLVMPMRR